MKKTAEEEEFKNQNCAHPETSLILVSASFGQLLRKRLPTADDRYRSSSAPNPKVLQLELAGRGILAKAAVETHVRVVIFPQIRYRSEIFRNSPCC